MIRFVVALTLIATPAAAEGDLAILNSLPEGVVLTLDGQPYQIVRASSMGASRPSERFDATVAFQDGRSFSQTLDFTDIEPVFDEFLEVDTWCITIMADRIDVESTEFCYLQIGD